MPRNGSGVYSLPAGSTFTPNTLAQSSVVNSINNDIATDLNTVRPIVAGGTGASSAAAALAALGADAKVAYQTKSANYTAILMDNNSFIRFTAGVTLSLTAAATLGANWHLTVAAATGTITITPSGAELINGASSIVIPQGEGATVICDGTAFYTFASPGAKASSGTGRWAKTANGMLTQSGSIVAPTGATGNITITFATAFGSTDYDVVGYLGDNLAPVLVTERRADHVAASTTFISYNPGTGVPLPSGTTLRLTYVAFGVAP